MTTEQRPQIPTRLWNLARNGLDHAFEQAQLNGMKDAPVLFRLRDNRLVTLLVDPSGYVSGIVVGGQDGVRQSYNFDFSDIVAVAGKRKEKAGWWPWSYRYVVFDKWSV